MINFYIVLFYILSLTLFILFYSHWHTLKVASEVF